MGPGGDLPTKWFSWSEVRSGSDGLAASPHDTGLAVQGGLAGNTVFPLDWSWVGRKARPRSSVLEGRMQGLKRRPRTPTFHRSAGWGGALTFRLASAARPAPKSPSRSRERRRQNLPPAPPLYQPCGIGTIPQGQQTAPSRPLALALPGGQSRCGAYRLALFAFLDTDPLRQGQAGTRKLPPPSPRRSRPHRRKPPPVPQRGKPGGYPPPRPLRRAQPATTLSRFNTSLCLSWPTDRESRPPSTTGGHTLPSLVCHRGQTLLAVTPKA